MVSISKSVAEVIPALISSADEENIEKVVVGAVIARGGAVLLLERVSDDFMGGLVELPSGERDVGESVLNALVREVREETFLNIDVVERFVGCFDYLSSSSKKTRQFSFFVIVKNNNVRVNDSEHVRYFWAEVGSDFYNNLNISNETRRIIDDCFQ